MFITQKLIETCTGRSQQDGISRSRAFPCQRDSTFERACVDEFCRAPQLPRDFLRRRADEQGGMRFALQAVAEGRVIAAFVFAAQDDPKISFERVESFDGG